ncbi:hypothetical protein [Planococcus rifietoensis]|uniref:hypothetical protein n=1 Tax=Planococcus rifietoensis TaxID=200991 RepID=UPI0038503A7E
MKDLLKKEQGYALLITLIILLVFSILGISLMTMTMNGIAKNDMRQDVTRSTDLSTKGIDLITNQINTDLIKYLGVNGKTREEFIFQLERVLDEYECSNPEKIELAGETGSSEMCVEEYTNTVDASGEENPLRKLVTFNSIGLSGNSTQNLTSKVEIGAALAPEVLKYAIGTNIDLSDGLQPGEGNLLLHGGSDIQGDMKVDGNIVTSNNGYAFLGQDRWIPSILPSAIPLTGANSARLVLGKGAYTFSQANNYASHLNTSDFSKGGYSRKANIQDLFRSGYSPEIVSRNPNESPIMISEQKPNFEYNSSQAGVTRLTLEEDRIVSNKKMDTSKIFLNHNYTERVCIRYNWFRCLEYDYRTVSGENGIYTFNGANSFRQAATKGSAVMTNTNTTFKNGFYVEGNLSIGNNSTSYDSSQYSKVTLDGPIFVNGDLTIQGADLSSNALIYVNGEATIEYSRINGKPLPQNKIGSLIILSKGNIKISNNSVNSNDPSYIKGFFFSEKDFEMYGVGSNMKIDGGISARRIVLNAIRGRASNSNFPGAYRIPNRNDYFEGLNGQQSANSRLQVIYDTEIISTYSNLKQQEPIIYTVDPPTEVERSN